MTFGEQARVIRALCNNVRDEALHAIPKLPAEWGHAELREFVATLSARNREPLPEARKAEIIALVENLTGFDWNAYPKSNDPR